MIEIIDSLEKETAVVFTGVRDMKLFKLQVDTSFLTKPNIVIDSENIFKRSEVSSIYPQVIFLKKERVAAINIFDKSLLLPQIP